MRQKTFNIIGATLLLIVAAILAIAGSPSSVMPLNAAEEISIIAMQGDDRIAPLTLAESIIAGNSEYYLLDIREPSNVAEISIEGSTNIPFPSLMTKAGVEMLPKYKKIVIVYDDGARAGQTWTVLRGKGFDTYILDGGIKGWWDQVMNPELAQQTDPNQETREFYAKVRAMQEHFTGTGSQLSAPPAEDINIPPPPAPVKAPLKTKKKMGGC